MAGLSAGRHTGKEGTKHWWVQRLTSVALVPLSIWFAVSVVVYAGADYETMQAWIGSPVVAGLMVLLIVVTFYHAYLGIEVVLDDYVHHDGIRLASLVLTKGAALLLGAVALFSVLKILFGG